jgi:hypothetical protein
MKAVPIPIIEYDPVTADLAFAAHRALIIHELQHPDLRNNPEWQAVRDYAYRRFARAYEAGK